MMLTASSQNPLSEKMCAVATLPFNVMFVVVGTYRYSKEIQLALIEQPPQTIIRLGVHTTALPDLSSIQSSASPLF